MYTYSGIYIYCGHLVLELSGCSVEVAALHSTCNNHYTGCTLISALIPQILVGHVLEHPLIYYEEMQANS